MATPKIELVGPRAELRAGWRRLYDSYATFYKREMTDPIAEAVWGWITSDTHELECVIALQDGKPVGLAHYRRMPSPLRGQDIGFLDDLFILPEARGQGVGELLFAHLRGVAQARGWGMVRWITADDNYRARTLYDKLAKKTAWNLYEMSA